MAQESAIGQSANVVRDTPGTMAVAPPPPPQTPAAAPTATPAAPAPAVPPNGPNAISQMLGNLGSLQNYGFTPAQIQALTNWYTSPAVQLESTDQQALDLWTPGNPASAVMQQRFPGIFTQMKNGQTPMSTTDYVQYEQDIKELASSAGLPSDFISSADIGQMVASGMTLNDLGTRISDAQTALQSANPDTLQALKSYYGISPTNGALVAYALNPDHPLFSSNGTSLQTIFQSAEVGGAGMAEGFDVSKGTAQQAVTEGGVTGAAASSDFNRVAPELALTRGYGVLGSGVGTISQDDLSKVALGIGGEKPQEELLQASQKRASSVSGGGGFTPTARGTGVGSARETGSQNEGA